MGSREADVVVVGAGFAGLAAARTVAAAGAEPLVLEARDRVGGRTLNAEIGRGQVVEMGGQWMGPTQDRLAALANEVGVETFPSHTEGHNLLRLDGRVRRYRGTIPRLGPVALLDVWRVLRRLDRLSRGIDLERPWASEGAARLDSVSLGAWLERSMLSRRARALMRVAARTIWGAEPEEMALLHALFYIHSAGGFDMLTETEGGGQQDRFVGGSQLIAQRVAERLGTRVALNAAVTRIAHRPDGVVVRTARGEEVEARRAILALPPPLTAGIEFEPDLPPARRQLAQRMPQGWLVKTTAVYDEPFWRAEGLSGEAISEDGPVTMTFDNTPPGGSPGAIVGFIGGRDARSFARLGKSERRQAVVRCLESLFGARAAAVEAYLEQDWAAEPWSGGGPACYFGTGGWTASGALLRQPLGPIHWAGTETATKWNGYMDGAVSSGERAAAETLASL